MGTVFSGGIKKLSFRGATVAIGLGAASLAFAGQDYKVFGFSTIAFSVMTSKDDLQKEYIGVDRKGSFDRDTKIGLNLSFPISREMTFAVQLVARGFDFYGQDYAGHHAVFDWFFLRHQLSSEVELRIGRQPLPFSLIAETQDVGYVNPWIRPPVEVYSMIPLKSVLGVQSRYRIFTENFGELVVGIYAGQDSVEYGFKKETVDGTTGAASVSVARDARGRFTSMGGGFVTYDIEAVTLNLAIFAGKSEISADFPTEFPTGQPFPPSLSADFVLKGEQQYQSKTFGARWDREDFLTLAEYRQVDYKNNIMVKSTGYQRAYYGTVGYKIGKVMPMLTHIDWQGKSNSDITFTNPVTKLSTTTVKQAEQAQTSQILGFNVQINDRMLGKIEYLQARNRKEDQFGTNTATLFPGKKVSLVSTSIDLNF